MFGSASATPSGLRSSRTEHPQHQRPKGWAKTNRRSGPSQFAKLMVERSFAWAARFRRLVRDYERLDTTLKGFHYVAFACLMIANMFKQLA